jgi:hypothetical protein
MAEPTSTTVAVGATAAALLLTVDSAAGHALIIFGALVGVMHSVAKVETPTRTAAAWYVLKWVLTAALLTGFVSAMLNTYLGIPAQRWPGVVAFGITFLADRWPQWLTAAVGQRLGINQERQP